MTDLELLKMNILEKEYPYFDDDQLNAYLEIEGSVKAASYRCLIIKAENTSLSVSGLNCADTSKYFMRIAQRFRASSSRIL